MVQQSGGDESSTGMLVETLVEQTKERTAEEFLDACKDDTEKRAMVLELCRKVLSLEQYNRIASAEQLTAEAEKNQETYSEKDEKGNNDYEKEDDDSSTDDSIPTMKHIDDKPYTNGISAETGELPFEEFKDLLEPNEDQRENQPEQSSRRGKRSLVPKKDAINQFGEVDATMLVNWHHHVKHSGQLYSDEWLEGKIRDINLGKIEKQMLLMCLQETRICKAIASVLGKICEALNLQSILKKALEVWGVADKFRAVWARKPGDQYTDNFRSCRQCEIFVARAYVCITTLKHTDVSDDLGNKLLSCFVLMEENLPRDLAKTKVRRKSIDSGRKSTVSSTHPSSSDAEATYGIIQQLHPETKKILDEFSSTEDIVNRIGDSQLKGLKEPTRYILKVLKGEQTTACGFIWRYKEKSKSQEAKTSTTGKSTETEHGNHTRGIDDKQRDSQDVLPNERLDKAVSTRPEQSEASATLTATTSNTPLASHNTHKDTSGDSGNDRVIEQVNPDTGEVVGEFSSVRDIENSIGHSLNNSNPKKYVLRVLKGDQKTFHGFIWRYKGETRKNKPGNTTGDSGDGTSAQHRGKRKASDDDSEVRVSKRTKPNLGDTRGLHAGPDVNGNHDSIAGVGGNGSSGKLSMRAITAMDDVKESPYLKERNAEVGEAIFDYFKDLLMPRGSGRHLEASQPAKDLFGETQAREMVTANNAIAKSGMVYGSDWKNGNIQGKKCGLISTHLLLLCLQEQRLASSSTGQLNIVVSELGVVDMVKDAVQAWKLESDFPLLPGMKNSSALRSKTKALFLCLIFVARSYRCMKALGRKNVTDSIMRKVHQCLALVHSSLEQKQAKETTQEKGIVEGSGDKSVQSVGRIQKTNCHQHERTRNLGHSRLVEKKGSPEPANPGFIMHNLFLKPAKVSEEPPKKKPKPIPEPNRAADPSTRSFPGPTTSTNRVEGKKSNRQNAPQKKPPNQPAHSTLQTKQRTESQPASKNLQNTQQALNEQAQDSCLLRNQQKQTPTNPQNANKCKASRTRTEPPNPTSARRAPNNGMNPGQSIKEVELPEYIPPVGDWFPRDEILDDRETELAWLTSECSFALRKTPSNIDWQFIWKYASPLLKMELREKSGETELDRLVRLHDGFVRKRFEFLKGTIEKGLNMGQRRPHMEQVIRVLRKRSRLANQRRPVVATV